MNQKIKILSMCFISLSSIFGCSFIKGTPTEKVGHHLQKIKDIEYKRSLKKIDATVAVKKIMSHMIEIEKIHRKILESEPIKELLTSFLTNWNSESKILDSLTDGNQDFITVVTTFFMRGYVKEKDGWKTPFPMFKP